MNHQATPPIAALDDPDDVRFGYRRASPKLYYAPGILGVLLLLGTACFSAQQVYCQTDTVKVKFSEEKYSVKRNREKRTVLQFSVVADQLLQDTVYSMSITVNDKETILSKREYELDIPFTTVKGAASQVTKQFYVTITADSLPDRDRTLQLEMEVKRRKQGVTVINKEKATLTITVHPSGPELDDYNYLAYIGTNFDLVDGVQTNNLFFATNIFIPKSVVSRHGMYMSLYGNRAVTSIDSSSNTNFLSGLAPTSDTTYQVFYKTGRRVTTFSADNLGAYYSPFFGLGKLSEEGHGVRYHFAPALEFVWRRTTRTTTFSDATANDTISRNGMIPTAVTLPLQFTQKENRFEFKFGPGIFISHDNAQISVHIYACAGLSELFIPDGPSSTGGIDGAFNDQWDGFFTGRAWITEPTSGLTLQAEIVNTLIHPRPYFVVTLSKAVAFKHLGSVFSPITQRTP